MSSIRKLACAAILASSAALAAERPVAPVASAAGTAGSAADEPAPPSGLHCLRETGSLIRPGKSGCIEGVHGTTVDREEFEQRSGFNTADFLKYDPSLNVH